VLDGIQDPVNLGPIIILCDWFGITEGVCSSDTVACDIRRFVQATMGSLARVNITYVDIEALLLKTDLPIYGGVLEGVSVYQEKIAEDCYLVVGNEGNGISEKIITLLSHKITIPQYGVSQNTESLNVATATAILLSEAMRPTGK
jgi:TrmH family RNA methyltransferase